MIPHSLTFAPQIQEPQTIDLMNGQFTPEQHTHLERLREQNALCPDSFQLSLDFRRLSFARWLVLHGYLSEEVDTPSEGKVT